jgi:putative heme transporter
MVVIAAGAGVAVYAERATVAKGLAVLPHLRVGWLLAGIGAECLSMLAFGQLQRILLRAGGARLSLGSVLGIVYRANVIAVAVPVIGSGIATASLYRDFRRSGAQAAQVSMALTVAGVLSSVAFAVVVVALGAALVNWLTDVACLVCALKAAGAGVPWSAILIVWTAGRAPRASARLPPASGSWTSC